MDKDGKSVKYTASQRDEKKKKHAHTHTEITNKHCEQKKLYISLYTHTNTHTDDER